MKLQKRKDLTGQRFGHLTAIKPTEERLHNRTVWECKCDCGKTKIVSTNELARVRRENTNMSCGCIDHRKTHGETKERLYVIRQQMKQRCYNPNDDGYKNYGGCGITICDEWLNSYETFREWALKHGYEENLTIERLNNDIGYCPENCTWISKAEQNRNKQNTNHVYFNGKKLTLPQLAESVGMPVPTIQMRFYEGLRGADL